MIWVQKNLPTREWTMPERCRLGMFSTRSAYTYSPADPEYIVSVPLFDEVRFTLGDNTVFTIRKEGSGKRYGR